MDKPLVSIIVPAYNAAPYIGAAVESVQRQTYDNWELIIVDDGSTDKTADVVKNYAIKDQRIKYFYQTNQRMAAARNRGLKEAEGKYIAFLDADNIFLPEKLEQQAAYMEKHSDCGLCFGKIYHFYDGKPDELYANRNERNQPSGNIFPEILRRNFLNLLAVMVRKEMFDRYGAFQGRWPACDEHFVWINLAYQGVQFCKIEEVVGLERLHQASDSLRPGHLLDTANCFLELLDIVESWFTPQEKKKYHIDIARLRQEWQRRQFIGKMLNNPPSSWFLMPLYRMRRQKHYYYIGTRNELGISVW